jgi:hypothetical protein
LGCSARITNERERVVAIRRGSIRSIDAHGKTELLSLTGTADVRGDWPTLYRGAWLRPYGSTGLDVGRGEVLGVSLLDVGRGEALGACHRCGPEVGRGEGLNIGRRGDMGRRDGGLAVVCDATR